MQLEAGLLFDGNQGVYNTQRVIELAKTYGMEVEDFQGLTSDEMQFLEDDAIEYLENFAPDGHWVGYNEGDFGVWPIVEED